MKRVFQYVYIFDNFQKIIFWVFIPYLHFEKQQNYQTCIYRQRERENGRERDRERERRQNSLNLNHAFFILH